MLDGDAAAKGTNSNAKSLMPAVSLTCPPQRFRWPTRVLCRVFGRHWRVRALGLGLSVGDRSDNAPDKRDVLGTLMMGVLAGHRCYAHITALRRDAVAQLLAARQSRK